MPDDAERQCEAERERAEKAKPAGGNMGNTQTNTDSIPDGGDFLEKQQTTRFLTIPCYLPYLLGCIRIVPSLPSSWRSTT